MGWKEDSNVISYESLHISSLIKRYKDRWVVSRSIYLEPLDIISGQTLDTSYLSWSINVCFEVIGLWGPYSRCGHQKAPLDCWSTETIVMVHS